MENNAYKIGTVFYVLWGIIHIVVLCFFTIAVLAADVSSPMSEGTELVELERTLDEALIKLPNSEFKFDVPKMMLPRLKDVRTELAQYKPQRRLPVVIRSRPQASPPVD